MPALLVVSPRCGVIASDRFPVLSGGRIIWSGTGMSLSRSFSAIASRMKSDLDLYLHRRSDASSRSTRLRSTATLISTWPGLRLLPMSALSSNYKSPKGFSCA
jgi:hypothetical protein